MAKFDSATFEEVNAEVESLDLQAYATAEAVAVESVAGIRETVCEIYQVVRKIGLGSLPWSAPRVPRYVVPGLNVTSAG